MADYNRSVVHTFNIPGDATNIYAMIDASIVADIKDGLTIAQKAVIDGYIWTPTTPAEIAATPRWGGNDPVAVYFRATPPQMQAAMAAKYYR